jgi:glycosyltransferase involved in cell wall biosynthesis
VLRRKDQEKPYSVLHLITTLDVGGAEMSLLNLVSRMDDTRFRSHIVCLSEMGPVGEKLLEHGIPVRALNMPKGRVTIRGLVRLRRLIREIKPDILQTWMYHADLLGILFGRWCGSFPICWNIRCSNMALTEYPLSTRITVKLCTVLSRLPDVIIANSKDGERYHRRMGYKGKRWAVIPNGFDLGLFQPDGRAKEWLAQELGLDVHHPLVFIGYIARFDPMKDHPTFLHAASQLLKTKREVHFVLAGRNVERDNRGIVERIPHELEAHFHLLGERNDIERITAALDVACSVSFGEGFPNVIGEAMACGVPCVVTDVGDSGFIIGETGVLVRPRDSKGLSDAWHKLLELGATGRAELGRAARQRIRDCFEIVKTVKRYEMLYAFLVDERRRCRPQCLKASS